MIKPELDTREFWIKNDESLLTEPAKRKRVPMGFWLDDHFLFEEMKIQSTLKYYEDHTYRLELHRLANDRLEASLGKRFFSEDGAEEPSPNRFEVIMGSHWKLTEGATPWLESSVTGIDDVKRLNERNSGLDMRKEAFPEDWKDKKAAYEGRSGKSLSLGGSFSRGPATMATSILGVTNACMFILTDPEVMDDFFAILCDKLIEFQKALMQDTGRGPGEGFQFNDDNCYLFSPELYERFCSPFIKKVFAEFAPRPEHTRYQHSDSTMGHLMGILSDLGINRVNLGPTLSPLEIRKAMPRAEIYGQMPPFTLRNGSAGEIIRIVRRDIEDVGGDGRLVECTAGSVAGGTPLENIRTYMEAVHNYGRLSP